MAFEWVLTADGSFTCRDSETGQLCHNKAGAYTEALQNYVLPSEVLDRLQDQGQARVLDACYGLGYNTWVLIDYCLKTCTSPFTLSIVAVERSPEMIDFWPRLFEHPTLVDLKMKIDTSEHNIDYRTLSCISDTKEGLKKSAHFVINVANGSRLEIELHLDDLRQAIPKLNAPFDVVFHDPFSPQKMPELWSVDLFREYFRLLREREGKVLTYSAAAAVRGGFKEAGFVVEKTIGLGEKNGGTLARISQHAPTQEPAQSQAKIEKSLPQQALKTPATPASLSQPLLDWEADYLNTRAGLPYRDPGLQQSRESILAAREAEQASSTRVSGQVVLKQKRLQDPNSKHHW